MFTQLMKDINFLDLNNMYWDKKILRISNDKKNRLNETIKRDSEFLERYNIMDYSLLIVGETLSNEDMASELPGLNRN